MMTEVRRRDILCTRQERKKDQEIVKIKGTARRNLEVGSRVWSPLLIFNYISFTLFYFIFEYLLNLPRLHCFIFFFLLQYLELFLISNGYLENIECEWVKECTNERNLSCCLFVWHLCANLEKLMNLGIGSLMGKCLGNRWSGFTYLLHSSIALLCRKVLTQRDTVALNGVTQTFLLGKSL